MRLSGEIHVHSTKIILTVSLVAALFICMGVVSALNANEASVLTFPSSTTVQPGGTMSVRIIFNNNSTDTLQLTRVGLRFDWMSEGQFYGFDLSSSQANITVPAGNSYPFEQAITIQIPTNVTLGSHTYYVGVDGTQGADNTAFSWDSPTTAIDVVGYGGTVTTTTPSTSTTTPSTPAAQQNWLLYGAIAAIVVIVVLVLVVFMMKMRKKPKPESPASQPAAESPAPSNPEQKPKEQDFNI
jgi:hypothetical protein